MVKKVKILQKKTVQLQEANKYILVEINKESWNVLKNHLQYPNKSPLNSEVQARTDQNKNRKFLEKTAKSACPNSRERFSRRDLS